MKMHDKTVIITGSASGIGAETVRLFLEVGANVGGVVHGVSWSRCVAEL